MQNNVSKNSLRTVSPSDLFLQGTQETSLSPALLCSLRHETLEQAERACDAEVWCAGIVQTKPSQVMHCGKKSLDFTQWPAPTEVPAQTPTRPQAPVPKAQGMLALQLVALGLTLIIPIGSCMLVRRKCACFKEWRLAKMFK